MLTRTALILLLLLGGITSAVAFDGEVSAQFEQYEDEGEDAVTVWQTGVRFDDAALISPYLYGNFNGRYTDVDGEEDYTDIYAAFVEYGNFEDEVNARAGRFTLVDNRFLTLDGAEATYRTPYYVGVTAYAGVPRYFEEDNRHIDETFRDTGGFLYGTRVFLNGVKDTTAYVTYSNETEDSESIIELVGAGAGRRQVIGADNATVLAVNAKADYDMVSESTYRSSAMGYARYKRVALMGRYIYFNVEDGTDRSSELIITNFSTGTEERISYTLQYEATKNIVVYQGLVNATVEYDNGDLVSGDIVKAGLRLNFYREFGVRGDFEYYTYDSSQVDADGYSVAIDWNPNRDITLSVDTESVTLDEAGETETISSTRVGIEYMMMRRKLIIGAYTESTDETRFLPETRTGANVRYLF